jgi:hypothetical protein
VYSLNETDYGVALPVPIKTRTNVPGSSARYFFISLMQKHSRRKILSKGGKFCSDLPYPLPVLWEK